MSPRARLHWIFVGSQGIRAGWSVLIFILLLAVVIVPLQLLLHHYKPDLKSEIPAGLALAGEAVQAGLVLAATAIMARIEGRRPWSYGLGGPRPVANFLFGCAGGLACLSLLVGVLHAGGYLAFDGLALHGVSILAYGLVYLLVFTFVGLSEETLFRGYVQSTLTRGIGFWPAALLVSALFAASHIQNNGENFFGIVEVLVAGLVFCLLLRLSGSLWLGIGVHTAWDWSQSFLYGTPDSGLMFRGHLFITHAVGNPRISGGTAGPEGSPLSAPALIFGPLLLVWILRRSGLLAAPAAPNQTPAFPAGEVPQ
jgi:membrane protease YdiL (CAAX protease family)